MVSGERDGDADFAKWAATVLISFGGALTIGMIALGDRLTYCVRAVQTSGYVGSHERSCR
jgi:hypothetical protein